MTNSIIDQSLRTFAAVDAKFSRLRESCTCPLTRKVMRDPVIAADGFTYERSAMTKVISDAKALGAVPLSPLTRAPLAHSALWGNASMRSSIGYLPDDEHGLAPLEKGRQRPNPLNAFIADCDAVYREACRPITDADRELARASPSSRFHNDASTNTWGGAGHRKPRTEGSVREDMILRALSAVYKKRCQPCYLQHQDLTWEEIHEGFGVAETVIQNLNFYVKHHPDVRVRASDALPYMMSIFTSFVDHEKGVAMRRLRLPSRHLPDTHPQAQPNKHHCDNASL